MRRIVVDTNVLVSAILSPERAARVVLRLSLESRVRPLIGNALFAEYEDVLGRDALFARAPIGAADRAALLDAFLGVCEWVAIAFLWRPNLRDEADNHLVELAVAGNADWIVTRDLDLGSGEMRFDHIRIGTPGAFLAAAKEA
jgi:putative PIN family toxin of toxin-antitoxin system